MGTAVPTGRHVVAVKLNPQSLAAGSRVVACTIRRDAIAVSRSAGQVLSADRRPPRPLPGDGPTARGASVLLCTPASLSREVGLALGAQAGEGGLRDVLAAAGFTHVRRATETPLNMVLEVRA